MNVVDSPGWLEYFAAGPNASVAYLYFLPISPRAAELMSIGEYPRAVIATLNLAVMIPLFVALYRQGFGKVASCGAREHGEEE